MLSAAECLDKARELTAMASDCPSFAGEHLAIAEAWIDLAQWAEWQDGEMAAGDCCRIAGEAAIEAVTKLWMAQRLD